MDSCIARGITPLHFRLCTQSPGQSPALYRCLANAVLICFGLICLSPCFYFLKSRHKCLLPGRDEMMNVSSKNLAGRRMGLRRRTVLLDEASSMDASALTTSPAMTGATSATMSSPLIARSFSSLSSLSTSLSDWSLSEEESLSEEDEGEDDEEEDDKNLDGFRSWRRGRGRGPIPAPSSLSASVASPPPAPGGTARTRALLRICGGSSSCGASFSAKAACRAALPPRGARRCRPPRGSLGSTWRRAGLPSPRR